MQYVLRVYRCLTIIMCEVEQNSDNSSHTILHSLAHVAMTTLREGGAWWRDLSAVTLYHLLTMMQCPTHTHTQSKTSECLCKQSYTVTTLSILSHTPCWGHYELGLLVGDQIRLVLRVVDCNLDVKKRCVLNKLHTEITHFPQGLSKVTCSKHF